MIRVLHIVSSLGVGGGVMSVIMNYYRHIDRDQVQFDFLSFRQTTNTYDEEITRLGGRIYRCSRPSLKPGFQREIDSFFREHQGEYNIVHCHPVFAGAIFAKAAKKHGVTHVVQHSHTTQMGTTKLSAMRNRGILTLMGRRPTDFAACSQAAKKVFFWKAPEDVFLLYNAIERENYQFSPEARATLRGELGIPEDCLVLGNVGRFTEQKNHKFLIEVFHQVHQRKPEARLLLVGDGELMEACKKQVQALGLTPWVYFVGRQTDIRGYMSAMDVFLLPSLFEGFPVVLVEAQANGLPAVVSNLVTEESKLTERVTFLPLGTVEQWVNEVLRHEVEGRPTAGTLPEQFDIAYTAKRLENYYYVLLEK